MKLAHLEKEDLQMDSWSSSKLELWAQNNVRENIPVGSSWINNLELFRNSPQH